MFKRRQKIAQGFSASPLREVVNRKMNAVKGVVHFQLAIATMKVRWSSAQGELRE
jgi:hypothetical protein